MSLLATAMTSALAKALLERYEKKLDPDFLPTAAKIAAGLRALPKAVPLDLSKATDVTPAVITKVQKAIKLVQQMAVDESSGSGILKEDGMLGKMTLGWLLTKSEKCAGEDQFKKTTKRANTGEPDVLSIRYWVEKMPTVDGQLGNKTADLLDAAWLSWKRRAVVDARTAATKEGANLIIHEEPIDGASGVLADANLGPPDGTVFTLRFDKLESWVPDKFQATACHEFGHVLGLTHASGPGQLMSAFRSSIVEPTETDVERLLKIGPWTARKKRTGVSAAKKKEAEDVLFS